jgi:hypothetical protein
LPAFDSHFHFDRTCAKIWGTAAGKTPEDIITYGKKTGSPDFLLEVHGRVMVISEPCNYHLVPLTPGGWKIAVGGHPKHITVIRGPVPQITGVAETSHHISIRGSRIGPISACP